MKVIGLLLPLKQTIQKSYDQILLNTKVQNKNPGLCLEGPYKL